ncbi:MAG: hypothetical protein ABI475_11380 [Methylophilaceae bacterium]
MHAPLVSTGSIRKVVLKMAVE